MLGTEYKVDKTGWGDGPWMSEPDRVDFVFAGLACLALRHPRHGYWCGYVGVPREHPLYGRRWDCAPGLPDLEVHQGINYSAPCDGGMICHVPRPGMPDDVWWLGFACAGAFDRAPAIEARLRAALEAARSHENPVMRRIAAGLSSPEDTPGWLREVYRPLAYVRSEIEHLAVQLAALMPAPVAVSCCLT